MSTEKESINNMEDRPDEFPEADATDGDADEANEAPVLEAEPVASEPAADDEGHDDASGPDLAALEAALAKALQERDAMKDQALRARAELDNYRKRTAREIERIRETAAENLIRELLPVLDHLELALTHAHDDSGSLGEGVLMVVKQFLDVLGRFGVEPIDALGKAFDPNLHEAVMQREQVEAPMHTVVEDFQKGYLLGGRVLRPSKVVVSTGGPDREVPADTAGESETNVQDGEMESEAPEETP